MWLSAVSFGPEVPIPEPPTGHPAAGALSSQGEAHQSNLPRSFFRAVYMVPGGTWSSEQLRTEKLGALGS